MATSSKKKIPRTVQDTIPYKYIYDNGVFESENGLFSKAYKLEDINFNIAPYEEQKAIYFEYQGLLNAMSSCNNFQIIIHNFKADKIKTLRDIRFNPQRDGLNRYRQEVNNILFDKLSKGNNSIRQNKYLVITHKNNNLENALRTINNMDRDVEIALRRIAPDKPVRAMTTEERLETLYNIYNKDKERAFGNDVDANGKRIINLTTLAKQRLTTKDIIGPSGFKFNDNHFKVGDTFARVMYLQSYSHSLTTDFLSDLANINAEMLLSLNFKPIESSAAIKMIKAQLRNINAELSERQKGAIKEGYSPELISPEITAEREAAKELMDDMARRDQKMFKTSLMITIFADTKEELAEFTRQINELAKNTHQCLIQTLLFQQEDGFNACLPLGVNELSVSKYLTTESSAIFMPYTSQELHQKNGIFYGMNKITKNLIFYDRMNPKAQNFNGLIIGNSGSGKSFGVKSEILLNQLKSDKNRVYIIDPESEYHLLANALNGEIIELSATSKTFLNPFDMDIEYSGEDDPIAMKTEHILGMIEIMMDRNEAITSKEKSIIDRCVKYIYRGYIDHMNELSQRYIDSGKIGLPPTIDRAATPTLANLYYALLDQPQEEAQNIANTIEIYTQGSLSTFSHRSNVNTNKNMVVYDIKNLGRGLRPLGLHICLNDIWNKMFENYRLGLNTYIYIDEFYLLLNKDSIAQFLQQIWKRARKWRCIPTGIVQNTTDLLISPYTKNIINNTSFFLLYRMQKTERDTISELLQIQQSQLDYINGSDKGHGLIYTGDTILPFNNEYPVDSEVYKIMNTTR